MEDTINERINDVVQKFGYRSGRQLALKIGIAPTSLNDVLKNGAEPKYSTLIKILNAEPSISAEWLLRGEGDMLRSEQPSQKKNESLEIECQVYKRLYREKDDETGRLREEIATLRAENTRLKEEVESLTRKITLTGYPPAEVSSEESLVVPEKQVASQ